MPAIIRNAEEKLLEHLQSVKEERERWGMAIINGSRMDRAVQRLLRGVETQSMLAAATRDAGIMGYICEDADIALLFCGTRKRNWPELQRIAHEALPHLDPEHIDFSSLFTFFDLKHDFDAAVAWVEMKQFHNPAPVAMPSPEAAWNAGKFSMALQVRAMRKKPLVAVVEDNSAQRLLAKDVLKAEYGVVLAHDGLEALELYNVLAPDLIFLDIHMPGLDGISVLTRIMAADPKARVVMFSTQSSADMLQKAIHLGAKGFVTKPFTADALLRYAGKTLAG